MTAAKKVPADRFICDDFTVRRGREVYRPHKGEFLEILTGQTVGQFIRDRRIPALMSGSMQEGLDRTAAMEFVKALQADTESTLVALQRKIVAWSWTDGKGVPYSSPPTVEDLGDLSQEELRYLWSKINGSPAASKNGSSPSTGSSTERKAGRRRKSG